VIKPSLILYIWSDLISFFSVSILLIYACTKANSESRSTLVSFLVLPASVVVLSTATVVVVVVAVAVVVAVVVAVAGVALRRASEGLLELICMYV
jgi:hypothetical protein